MNWTSIFILGALGFLMCSENQSQNISAVKLLTGGSSKEWEIYEHNHSAEDNTTFVNTPPYIFLNIYSPDYLLLRNDFTFELGQEGRPDNLNEQWSLTEARDSIGLGSTIFSIVKLTDNELFIRQRIELLEGKSLPYYEYRFKKKED